MTTPVPVFRLPINDPRTPTQAAVLYWHSPGWVPGVVNMTRAVCARSEVRGVDSHGAITIVRFDGNMGEGEGFT